MFAGKPGSCPFAFSHKHVENKNNLTKAYLGITDQSAICTHTCNHDLDCSGELKCCPTKCNDAYGKRNNTACQVPRCKFTLYYIQLYIHQIQEHPQILLFFILDRYCNYIFVVGLISLLWYTY